MSELLGQISQYMRDLKLTYGYFTNYNETVFLRQVCDNGAWGLEYSPVIRHHTEGQKDRPAQYSGNVSVRE